MTVNARTQQARSLDAGRVWSGDERLRDARGIAAVRRTTSHSHGVAIHVFDIDVRPGESWNDLSSEVADSVSIVLSEAGGRVETRLARHVPNPNGRSTMSFTPAGMPLWGYSRAIRRVKELRLDFSTREFVERVGGDIVIPRRPLLIRDERVRTLASYLAAECERPGVGASLYLDGLTVAVGLEVLRAVSPSAPPHSSARALPPHRLRRAMDLLSAQVDTPVRLERIAGEVGVSPSWFGRAFKASTGVTPYQWQLDRRIETAQSMLAAGRPPAEVALATGFAEQSHFTRVFRQRTGVPPGKWQAAHRRRD